MNTKSRVNTTGNAEKQKYNREETELRSNAFRIVNVKRQKSRGEESVSGQSTKQTKS